MITPTKYQPLLFYQGNQKPCYNCDECDPWVQKMFPSDYIPFQFKVDSCFNKSNSILNHDFAADGLHWNELVGGLGGVEFNPPLSPGAHLKMYLAGLFQLTPTFYGKWYDLKIIIRTSLGLENAELKLLGIQGQPTIPAIPGEVHMTVFVDGAGFGFERRDDQPGTYIVIESVEMVELSLPTVEVYDDNDVMTDTITNAYIDDGYLNIAYKPNAATIDAELFYFKVDQDCDTFHNTWKSELIKIVPDDKCLIQVAGCSTNNIFKGNFTPYMRIDAKLISDQAPVYERNLQRKTTGSWRLNYGRATKVLTLQTDYLPEHVRDFIYLFPIFETVAIKKGTNLQKGYFVHTEPDAPDFKPSSDEFARISMPVVFKQELIETIFENECNVILPPKMLGDTQSNQGLKVDTNVGLDAT